MIREHMTPERHSNGYKIAIAIQNMWDQNERLSRTLPDLNERINGNIQAVIDQFDLTLDEWHVWCKYTRQALG